MAPSNGTYEEAIQEAEEQVEKIKLPQEPMNEIVDSILPPNYSMDENSRVAISRALSIFTVCLAAATHDAAESAGRSELKLDDLLSGLQRMDWELPHVDPPVPPKKHERRVAGDDAIEQEADSSDEAEAEPQ